MNTTKLNKAYLTSVYIFSVLPRLRSQCNGRAVPLEDLLSEKGFHKILCFITNLDAVADLKVIFEQIIRSIKKKCYFIELKILNLRGQ